MANDKNTLSKEIKYYLIPDYFKIKLYDDPTVWAPRKPTIDFIDLLNRIGTFAEIKEKTLLDLGTGSGILGLIGLVKGASFVTLSDINKNAIAISKKNILLNNFDESQFECIYSDRFKSISKKDYDFIISNPPVQPEIFFAHSDDIAAKSNENGDGRLVLDALISQGRGFLKKKGKMYFCSSSRHGHVKTIELLNKHWGKNNWRILKEEDYPIDWDYHGPYIEYWLTIQQKDKDVRIFDYDTKLNLTCEGINSKTSIDAVKKIENFGTDLQAIKHQKWFYRHYIIEAINQ